MAEKKFAFVVNQSEAHLIEPASSAENIARKAVKPGKVNRCIDLQIESRQPYFMTIGDERAGCRADPLRCAVFNLDAELLAVFALKNSEARACVQAGLNASLFPGKTEDYIE